MFLPALRPLTRRIDLIGGRAGSRSHFLSIKALEVLTRSQYGRACYLRQHHNSHRISTFQALKDRIDDSGIPSHYFSINKSTMEIVYKPTGNNVIFLGAYGADQANKAKLKSLEGCTDLLIEEATEIGYDDMQKIRISFRTVRDGVEIHEWRAMNPPTSDHHIIKTDYNLVPANLDFKDLDGKDLDVYDYTPMSDADLTLVRSTYHHNIKNIPESTVRIMERLKKFDPLLYATDIRGYVGGGKRNKIYRRFMPISDYEYDLLLLRPVYVIDFGYSEHPTCVLEVKSRDNKLFVKELIYEPGLDDLALARRMRDFGITYQDLLICDYGNGGDVRISNLCTAGGGAWQDTAAYPDISKGFNAVYATKGSGSVVDGIEQVKTMEVYITESSVNTWNESRTYSWAEDKNGNPLDYPIDKDNHAMDCIRYAGRHKLYHGL